MTSLPDVVVVGCGKVGGSLAIQLKRLDWPIRGLASRRLSSARALADELGSARATDIPWEITPGAGVVFITTPDGAIGPVCNAIARNKGFTPGTTVLHCSGAHPSTLLATAAEAGAAAGSFHPLQAFAAVVRDRNPFSEIIMAVEGAPLAVKTAEHMAVALNAIPLRLKTEGKTLYHAAAVVASNYLVSLVDVALEMLTTAGIAPENAFSVLAPLINGTLANIAGTGTTEALTGPIVRGDAETVALHMDALRQQLAHLLPAYRSLGQQALRITLRKGHIPDETLAALERLLAAIPPDELTP